MLIQIADVYEIVDVYEIAKEIDVIQAIEWVTSGWKEVSAKIPLKIVWQNVACLRFPDFKFFHIIYAAHLFSLLDLVLYFNLLIQT